MTGKGPIIFQGFPGAMEPCKPHKAYMHLLTTLAQN